MGREQKWVHNRHSDLKKLGDGKTELTFIIDCGRAYDIRIELKIRVEQTHYNKMRIYIQ